MSSPSPSTAPNKGEVSTRFSTVYNVVMTPLIFTSFVVSLVWVDFRYSLMRSHSHSDAPSRMPHWLHTIIYREAPYQYVRVDRSRPDTAATAESDWKKYHYHSKQRKLMKMEAEDAFRIRGSVLVVLGVVTVAIPCVAWQAVRWLWTAVTTRHS
ncbi:unnamed protein product [Discula destructiva]